MPRARSDCLSARSEPIVRALGGALQLTKCGFHVKQKLMKVLAFINEMMRDAKLPECLLTASEMNVKNTFSFVGAPRQGRSYKSASGGQFAGQGGGAVTAVLNTGSLLRKLRTRLYPVSSM